MANARHRIYVCVIRLNQGCRCHWYRGFDCHGEHSDVAHAVAITFLKVVLEVDLRGNLSAIPIQSKPNEVIAFAKSHWHMNRPFLFCEDIRDNITWHSKTNELIKPIFSHAMRPIS
jgi:hypothetical protein